MKITEVRTRVAQWSGETTPLPPHFCTNPMDLLTLPQSSMKTFTFHSWLVVEVMTDDGLVGIGNAALTPIVTKQVIDHHLKPLLLGDGSVQQFSQAGLRQHIAQTGDQSNCVLKP